MLLWLPLSVGAALVPHALAYRLAYSDPEVRRVVYAATGHAYFRYLPAALLVAVTLSAFAWLSIALLGRSDHGGRLPRIPFALLPPLLFFMQETTESAFHGGPSLHNYAEKTFLFGIAMQIPFGIVAYLLALSLTRLADELQQIVVSVVRPTFLRVAERSTPPPYAVLTARVGPLASRRAGRAPPPSSSR